MDILVQPLNRVIRVQPGANLLKALQDAQVPMSYSCMAGRCGTCRCRVLDGEVMEGSGELQRPLDGEQGYVLACQTYLTEPCTIEIPEPDAPYGVKGVGEPPTVVSTAAVAAAMRAATGKRLRRVPVRPDEIVGISPAPDEAG